MVNLSTITKWEGKKAISSFDKATLKSLAEAAILVHSRAVALTPVDSGLLRSSLTFSVSGKTANFPLSKTEYKPLTALVEQAIVGTVVYYAPYVEFGTRYMWSQSFLRLAYFRSLRDITKFFKKNYRAVRFVS